MCKPLSKIFIGDRIVGEIEAYRGLLRAFSPAPLLVLALTPSSHLPRKVGGDVPAVTCASEGLNLSLGRWAVNRKFCVRSVLQGLSFQ